MSKLTRRGRGWLLGEVPVPDGARVWMRALGLPWRSVTLRIVGGALLVEENPPRMPAVEPGAPLPMMRAEDVPPEPYPPPEDVEWSWEPPLEDGRPTPRPGRG